jgi:lysophospholipase L1-like esterase
MFAVSLFAFALLPCFAQDAPPATVHWVGTWASSQQIPEPTNALPPYKLRDATLRQIVHLSVGGARLRVHLSNAFGTAPLRIDSVHIARPVSPSNDQIDVTTDKALTFGGSSDVVIPAGAEYISDPVDYPVSGLSNLAISFHLDEAPAQQTGHPGSRVTSYVVHGNLVSAVTLPNAARIDHWYQIAGVDVTTPAVAVSIVALGDSITDGHASTTNGNDRWTDVLAERLQGAAATNQIGVLNAGIGGNHLLVNGLGPNALARFNRDVLVQTGVRYVIVLEGVNDLGGLTSLGEVPTSEHVALIAYILAAYQQMIVRAHAHGIEIIGATITPYAGSDYYHPTVRDEQDRNAINAWIRAPGHFDAVIDFDKVIRDPSHPDRLLPSYDSGDHLHPSPAGYRAMANAVPLSLFHPRLTLRPARRSCAASSARAVCCT